MMSNWLQPNVDKNILTNSFQDLTKSNKNKCLIKLVNNDFFFFLCYEEILKIKIIYNNNFF